MATINNQVITIDNVEYDLSTLSEQCKAQIDMILYVDRQMDQLLNELAVADTARLGYSRALKNEAAIQKKKGTKRTKTARKAKK